MAFLGPISPQIPPWATKRTILPNLYRGAVRVGVTLSRPKTPVAAKCDPDTAERIERAADEVGMSTSQFVASILERYVDQNPDRLEALFPEDPLESYEVFTRTYL